MRENFFYRGRVCKFFYERLRMKKKLKNKKITMYHYADHITSTGTRRHNNEFVCINRRRVKRLISYYKKDNNIHYKRKLILTTFRNTYTLPYKDRKIIVHGKIFFSIVTSIFSRASYPINDNGFTLIEITDNNKINNKGFFYLIDFNKFNGENLEDIFPKNICRKFLSKIFPDYFQKKV